MLKVWKSVYLLGVYLRWSGDSHEIPIAMLYVKVEMRVHCTKS